MSDVVFGVFAVGWVGCGIKYGGLYNLSRFFAFIV